MCGHFHASPTQDDYVDHAYDSADDGPGGSGDEGSSGRRHTLTLFVWPFHTFPTQDDYVDHAYDSADDDSERQRR